ncbi:MAG: fasciclin domain-containing protein, partial [Ilumatobacter sp.]
AILTYHVIGAEVPSSAVEPGDVDTVQGEAITIAADGDTLTVNDATITAVDVEASNGVIHVIDAVLVPPSIDPAALLAGDGGDEAAAPAEEGTIVEVADAAGTFTTLLAAGEATGISAVLDAPGAYTIFAPTDDAFAALPDGLLDALLLPENSGVLTAILTYHGLAAEVPSSDVAPGDVATIQGEEITITVDGDVIMVNDATITAVDVEANNGVIHVIDSVLVPPSIDVSTLLG